MSTNTYSRHLATAASFFLISPGSLLKNTPGYSTGGGKTFFFCFTRCLASAQSLKNKTSHILSSTITHHWSGRPQSPRPGLQSSSRKTTKSNKQKRPKTKSKEEKSGKPALDMIQTYNPSHTAITMSKTSQLPANREKVLYKKPQLL